MGVNPAVLAHPDGLQRIGGPAPTARSRAPRDYPAGYYKMFDMFKPGCLISVVWVVVMTFIMFAIAVPLGRCRGEN